MAIITPKYMTANVGDTVKFLCDINVAVEWNFKNGPLPTNARTGRVSKRPKLRSWRLQWLILTDVKLENAGLYTCYGNSQDHIIYEGDALLIVTGMLYNY